MLRPLPYTQAQNLPLPPAPTRLPAAEVSPAQGQAFGSKERKTRGSHFSKRRANGPGQNYCNQNHSHCTGGVGGGGFRKRRCSLSSPFLLALSRVLFCPEDVGQAGAQREPISAHKQGDVSWTGRRIWRLRLELAAGKSNTLEIMIPALGHLGSEAIRHGLKNVASASFLPNLKPQERWFIHLFNIQWILAISRETGEIQSGNTALWDDRQGEQPSLCPGTMGPHTPWSRTPGGPLTAFCHAALCPGSRADVSLAKLPSACAATGHP